MRPAETLITKYLKEEDDMKDPMDLDPPADEKPKHEDFDKMKETLDQLAQEHDMDPMEHEEDDDMAGGKYMAKGENAPAFLAAAKEALEPHVAEVSGGTLGKTATVEYKYR